MKLEIFIVELIMVNINLIYIMIMNWYDILGKFLWIIFMFVILFLLFLKWVWICC